MPTIPAQQIANVIPSVLSVGGTGLNGTGMMLSNNPRIPVGIVLDLPSETAVGAYFGGGSYEATESSFYFTGYEGATIQPSSLLMVQYNQTGVAAFLRGGNVSSLTIQQLQALSGSLDVIVDGYAHNASSITLSGANSFTAAANLIETGINASLATVASVTGAIAPSTFAATASIDGNVMTVTNVSSGTIVNGATIAGTGVTAETVVSNQLSGTVGGNGTYAVSISQSFPSGAVTGTYGTLTVSAVSSGTLAVGQALGGAAGAGTILTQLGTGTGTTGTYFVNLTQTVASGAITASGAPAVVSFDSTSGGFVVTSGITGAASSLANATGTLATPLMLTSATGAVISQGSAALTPAAFMSQLIITNSSWVNFMTLFDPDGGAGNAQKQAFAAWKNTALGGNRFGYMCWDPDDSPGAEDPAPSSLGQILAANGDSGTMLIWEGGATEDNGYCAFALGWAASINYDAVNGKTIFAFREQAGLLANVTDPTTAENLIANGYNFYGAYGSGNETFTWEQTGQITGPFRWADSFQTQIWLNSFLQVTLLTLFQNTNSIPFNTVGAGIINEALAGQGGPILQALAFGAFGPGVLSSTQIVAINTAAGGNAANTVATQGWYLQVTVPPPTVRTTRGPWPITFWYLDNGAVQSIDLSSVAVQ